MPRSACQLACLLAAAFAVGSTAPASGATPSVSRVTALTGMPRTVAAGASFSVRARVRSGRHARGRRARVFVLLSRDGRADRRDAVIGRRTIRRLPPAGRARTVSVRVKLPHRAASGSRLLACLGTRSRCRLAARRLALALPPSGLGQPFMPAAQDLACRNAGDLAAPDIGVRPGPDGARGQVLPGRALRSEIVNGEPDPGLEQPPTSPHYPGGSYPAGPPSWAPAPGGTVVHAADADARFNDEDARHRVAFHLSHYGGQPDSAGDFDGDGVEDLVVTEHFAHVDGMRYAGEVHLYFGRRGALLDPRTQVPDIIFYGDDAGGKLGLSVAPGGDVNGDGVGDLLMSAGFHDERAADGRSLPNAGEVYVVYGGYLQQFGCTVKVRTGDIGTRVPGLVLEGGHDGRRFTGWANDLEAGDFDGDGLSDVIVGAADPYVGDQPTFAARAYLLYGSRDLPRFSRGYRLGVDRDRDGIRSAVFEAPNGEVTRKSLAFGAFLPGDVNGDGRDDVVLTAGLAGAEQRGEAYVFLGRAGAPPAGVIAFADADTTIAADDSADPGAHFNVLESVRPAGDFDGDGREDFVVTARGTRWLENGVSRGGGGGAILYGRAQLPARLGMSELDTFLVGRSGTVGQPAMDRGADFDGDGFSDVLLNDPYFRESIGGEQQYRGRVWLVRGGPGRPRTIDVERAAAVTFVADTSVPGMFGYTWNTGDFNADGRPDVLVGDHYAGDHDLHEHAGRAYLFYNGSSFRAGS